MSKFKVGDKVVKADGEKWASGEKYKFITKINFWREEYMLSNGIGWWDEKELKLYEEVKEMIELTFKEVIANIKEGEVWESHCKKITGISVDRIRIESTIKASFGTIVEISNSNLYKLKRKECSFEQAFKAYEEGKEIESKSYRYKIINEQDKYYSKLAKGWIDNDTFDMDEIKGKWYIND